MTKARDLANLISTGNPLSDGALAASEVSGLATVATSGAYSDLSGSPSGDSLLPSQSGNADKFLTSNGSASSWTEIASGGSADFVASGAIANGDVVILNSNGTVSVATPEVFSLSEGTAVQFSSQYDGAITYDSTNNKIVIAWPDESNSAYGTARVGTIDPSDNSVTFGSSAVFHSGSLYMKPKGLIHDPSNNKIVIAYQNRDNSNYGTAVVATITGTSISFGTPVVFQSDYVSQPSLAYSPVAGKILFAWRQPNNDDCNAVVGSVSGNTISFGSVAKFAETGNYVDVSYITTADKFCISYKDFSAGGSAHPAKAVIATISGTSVSYGSANQVSPTPNSNSEKPSYIQNHYDTINDKIIFSYSTSGGGGFAVVGTLSGTSLSFGATVNFDSSSMNNLGSEFDENVGKILIFYRDSSSGSYLRKYIIGTVSGTSISFNTKSGFGGNTASTSKYTTTYDSGSKRTVIAWDDASDSENGYVTVFTVDGTANRTVSNYIGVASAAISDTATGSININGGINEGQSGLTVGTTYYVSDTGVLQTTNNGRKIGKAISATKLLVNSNMSGDEINAYLGGLV